MAQAGYQINVRMDEEEKRILARRATSEHVTEAEHIRNCVILDAFVAGDLGAIKLVGARLRAKAKERIDAWSAAGSQ